MRFVAAALVFFALSAGTASAVSYRPTLPRTNVLLSHYRAHDGVRRRAWLLLPVGYRGGPIPLVISPHGRGTSARANTRLWGDLPGLGGFAVVNPAGEGRRLGLYSWGDPGQIADLARMPAIVRAHGVEVDPHRIFAIGGSMGGQETLLLLARHPHLLAGAAAFDAPTNMAARYRAFIGQPLGASLQTLARREIGGTPATDPRGYALRSPLDWARKIAYSGVPLQIWWSTRDRVVTDQRDESGLLYRMIKRLDPSAPVTQFVGNWAHTTEMKWYGYLPYALSRFGLMPPREEPPALASTGERPV